MHPAIALPAGAIRLPVFVRLMVHGMLSGATAFARRLYNPSGSTVPSRPGYSAPESLAVRGRFEEAIGAYEAAAADEPDDPEPWLRIARIEASELRRPKRALEALRAARSLVQPESLTAMLISREIAEIYLSDRSDPQRAMPELARLAAAFPHTPTAAWAATQLLELKARLGAGEFDRWVTPPDVGAPPGSRDDEPGGTAPATSRAPD
ncbi:MAG TPA: tetratricopeptide repeat protein [Longimicrobiales bacterium]|nr:tetratricopeptide repeat protein [Longimicrobiales bacterium]